MRTRQIAAAAAGLLFFVGFVYAMNRLALGVWPAYAAAFPDRQFSEPMLMVRIAVSAVGLVLSGVIAAILSRSGRAAVVIAAVVMSLLGTANHLTEPTWSHYPLWYHLIFIGSIAPCILIGGLPRTPLQPLREAD